MNDKIDLISLKDELQKKYERVRSFSKELCEPLETEDFVIQSMPDVSPTKWHLAHTSWFFETFVLKEVFENYKSINDNYNYLFNSYYVQVGERFFRPNRGLLSRPTVKEVFDFRNYIDEHMQKFFETAGEELISKMKVVLEIGLNHEQQHQELMLTDIKHVFAQNPLYPVYRKAKVISSNEISKINWIEFDEGVYSIGFDKDSFFFDNEKPNHKTYLNSFLFADRLTTNKEYIDFIDDNGYSRTELWLSDGFAKVEQEKWNAPLYWKKIDNKWHHFTLNGLMEVDPNEPVCHVSFYEAEAYARWANARLAIETEWEIASTNILIDGNFVDERNYNPKPLNENNSKIKQMFGDVWEWTRSDYAPYPGYKIPNGAIGEYNGKFMSGQIVLRGGSCATSKDHIRNTYRNFFPHHSRWQFMGIRLAKDLE